MTQTKSIMMACPAVDARTDGEEMSCSPFKRSIYGPQPSLISFLRDLSWNGINTEKERENRRTLSF